MSRHEGVLSLPRKVVGATAAFALIGGVGAVDGVGDGLRDAYVGEIIQAEAVETTILKDPNITNVDFLNEQKFMRMTGAVATEAKLKHAFVWKSPNINVNGVNFPILIPLASTEVPGVYNYRLADAVKNKTKPNPDEVDKITVEIAFGKGVQQKHQEDVKPMAKRSLAEKNHPPVLTYTLKGEDLVVTPIATSDPIKRAAAFDSKVITATPLFILDFFKGVWDRSNGDPIPQTYSDGAKKAVEELALATAYDAVATTCTEKILSDQSTMQDFAIRSIKKIAVNNYNSTHTDEEKITEDDVEVVFEDIKNLKITNPWSIQLRANLQKFNKNAAANELSKNGSVSEPEEPSIIANSASCTFEGTKVGEGNR